MNRELTEALRRRQVWIRRRWETYLRLEKAASALANPDTLVFGVERSLQEIFDLLLAARRPAPEPEASCACGRHPLQAYYRAGEQAVLEALVITQVARAPLPPEVRDREFAEVKAVFTILARRDIAGLAGVCRLPPRD